MKHNIDKRYLGFGITSFLVIAASILFYYLVFHGDRFVAKLNALAVIASPILYGIIFAYLLTPIVNGFEKKLLIPLFSNASETPVKRKKKLRFLSIIMTIILVIFCIYGFFSILIPDLIVSIRSISNAFPYYVDNLSRYADNLLHHAEKYFKANPEVEKIFFQVIPAIDSYSAEFTKYLNNNLLPHMEDILKTVSSSLIGVLKVLWNLLIGLIISIYVLSSKEVFAGQAKKMIYALFSTKFANGFIRDMRFVSNTFIGFISGKIIDSVIIGIICFVGTSFLKIPYALLVSVIVGVTNIIPFFGPYLGAIPSTILILMINPVKCLYFIIFILILQQVDGNFIGPKILGQSTGLTGFWVIFSITIFGGLFGIIGMIVGVPFFAVIYAMVRRIIVHLLKKKGLSTATGDYMHLDYIDKDGFIPVTEKSKTQSNFKFPIKFNWKPKTGQKGESGNQPFKIDEFGSKSSEREEAKKE